VCDFFKSFFCVIKTPSHPHYPSDKKCLSLALKPYRLEPPSTHPRTHPRTVDGKARKSGLGFSPCKSILGAFESPLISRHRAPRSLLAAFCPPESRAAGMLCIPTMSMNPFTPKSGGFAVSPGMWCLSADLRPLLRRARPSTLQTSSHAWSPPRRYPLSRTSAATRIDCRARGTGLPARLH
jgi:hypothetical protein